MKQRELRKVTPQPDHVVWANGVLRKLAPTPKHRHFRTVGVWAYLEKVAKDEFGAEDGPKIAHAAFMRLKTLKILRSEGRIVGQHLGGAVCRFHITCVDLERSGEEFNERGPQQRHTSRTRRKTNNVRRKRNLLGATLPPTIKRSIVTPKHAAKKTRLAPALRTRTAPKGQSDLARQIADEILRKLGITGAGDVETITFTIRRK